LFQFQTETAILQEWFKTRAINQLIGFENESEKGKGNCFNFILSNGTRSTQRGRGGHETKYTFMIPADAINKIRSVTIHYTPFSIQGFWFFDKDGALLWKHGSLTYVKKKATVALAENEVIVGVVAKLASDFQVLYTDF
jgi:hypothetical protein